MVESLHGRVEDMLGEFGQASEYCGLRFNGSEGVEVVGEMIVQVCHIVWDRDVTGTNIAQRFAVALYYPLYLPPYTRQRLADKLRSAVLNVSCFLFPRDAY